MVLVICRLVTNSLEYNTDAFKNGFASMKEEKCPAAAYDAEFERAKATFI
jgi:hypothetical protein